MMQKFVGYYSRPKLHAMINTARQTGRDYVRVGNSREVVPILILLGFAFGELYTRVEITRLKTAIDNGRGGASWRTGAYRGMHR